MRSLDDPRLGRSLELRRPGAKVAVAVVGLIGAVAVAYLAASGQVLVALVLLAAVPAIMVINHQPLVVVGIWMVLVPFVADAPTPSLRKIFWLTHRAMPVLALALVVAGIWLGARWADRRGRLGTVEWFLVGYLVVSAVSVLYTSEDTLAGLYQVYDRILIPLCLFLLVVLLAPDEDDVRRLLPFAALMVAGQVMVGVLSWVAPGTLPSEWATRAGERTVGSLNYPGTFAVVLLTGVLVMAHTLANPRVRPDQRQQSRFGRLVLWALIGAGLVMVMITLSRAAWAAGIFVAIGLFVLHPRIGRRIVAFGVIILAVAAFTGTLASQLDAAQTRFLSEQSEESALSRLPLAVASTRMWQERPLLGFGYGNFEEFDREYQGEVAGVLPDKDHSSHNVYLRVAAEQGTLGFFLLLGPIFGAAFVTIWAWPRLAWNGFWSRRLVIAMWLAIGAHVIVNNFADSPNVFGLGLYALTLGLIVSIGRRHSGPVPARSRRFQS